MKVDWKYEDVSEFIGLKKENPFEGQVKNIDEKNILTEYDSFRLFFTDEIIENIRNESIFYYESKLKREKGILWNKKEYSKNSLPWLYFKYGISSDDILLFIGIRIYMGIIKFPTIDSYWNTLPIYTNFLPNIISKNRYKLLASALHIPDDDNENNNDEEDNSQNDPRHKIIWLLDNMKVLFQKYYILSDKITVDETMIPSKSRQIMKQYMPMKPIKWGFKLHCLTDAPNNYLYDYIFNPGKNYNKLIIFNEDYSYTESIILKLVEKLNDKSRHLYHDDWYASISLSKKLFDLGILETTVYKHNSKNLPLEIINGNKDQAYCSKIIINVFSDKKEIYFGTNYQDTLENIKNDYNIFNRGVDVLNQNIAQYSTYRKEYRWWKKIFLFIIDSCVNNAKVIFELLKDGKDIKGLDFRNRLICYIFENYNSNKFYLDDGGLFIPKFIRDKLHHMETIKGQCKKCALCSYKTNTNCIECDKPIHPDCFTKYHQNKIYNLK